MNHGYDDDEGDFEEAPQPGPRAGPSGLLAQLMGGMGGMGGMGYGGGWRVNPPSAYDEYFKAYSVAVMDRKERPELLYGGKIIMPPSALARLTSLDIEGPWTFHLRNPRAPNVRKTHAGVLEFIAEEGIVHLPAWMMKTLDLNEGDPVRLNGALLPKGKRVKIQAQSTDFLQVSDAKAVLESALRFYSVLSVNDIIEITYNNLTFEFLIMETIPEGPGISIIDTDLEVDFETPVGYVEPARPAPAPVPTMAEKLKIDLGGTTLASASAGSSRPASVASSRLGGAGAGAGGAGGTGSGEATPLESFTGVGQSLSGKKIKGKGLAKKIEEVDAGSKINRSDGPRIITPDSFNDDRKVPAALTLPQGKFFFGFKYIPFDPSKQPKKEDVDIAPTGTQAFSGEGTSLKNKNKSSVLGGNGATSAGGMGKGKGKEKEGASDSTAAGNQGGSTATTATTVGAGAAAGSGEKEDPWVKLGSGNALKSSSTSRATTTASGAIASASATAGHAQQQSQSQSQREIIDATMLDEDDFFDVDEDEDDDDEGGGQGWDDDDVIEID